MKVLSANNKFHYNKKNNEKNKTKIIRNNIIKNKIFKNIIIKDKAIATKLTDNQNTYKFKYNNIGNSIDEEIANNNKKTNLIKKRNKSSNIYNFNNRDFLDNITQDNYKKIIYFNFRSNNKKLKTNKSFNIVNKNNSNYSKRVPLPNNKNINNKSNYYNSDSNSNIIINYINEMEKYNKMLMEQKLGNYQKISKEKKNKKNIFSHTKTNSCLNAPFYNKIQNISNIAINTNPFFSFTNNRKNKCNTEKNKIIHEKNYYIINQLNGKNINGYYTEKNTLRIHSSNHKRIKKAIAKKNITTINTSKNKNNEKNNHNNIDNYQAKIVGINYENKKLLNNNNSFSYKKNMNVKSTYKKDYENNSSNFFKNNSFLSNNFSSKKNNLEYNYINDTIHKSNPNYFSPILLNRLNNNQYKIYKANSTNNKIKIDNIINYKNKNIIKNLLDNYNNSLSTNYKDKQSTKDIDIDESGMQLCFKNNTSRNSQMVKSNTSSNINNNIFLNTNNKTSKEKNNNNNYLFPKNIKKNAIIKNIEKNLLKKAQNRKMIKTKSYNIPISTNKKQYNNNILQNISFSNNSPEQTMKDNHHIQSFNNISNIINSAIDLNNSIRHEKNISSLFSILKEDKKNIISEYRPQYYPCFKVINENFDYKAKNNNIDDKYENNNNDKSLKTSFESLSDSKMYELAKTYIEKDECLDKHEMEEILKNKKNSSKKKI